MTNHQLMQGRARFFTLGSVAPVAVATLAGALFGGCSSTPSAAVLTGDAGGGADTSPNRASQVVTDGYLMAGPWAGSGFTATNPGAATITPVVRHEHLHTALLGQ